MTGSSILSADELAAVRREYRAATLLPKRTYHDAAIFDWERREILRRGWVLVAREEDAPFDRMVADRYAGDPISAARTVRERYDVPPPRPRSSDADGSNGKAEARAAARAKATARG
ncbi:MAG: hypothetical protein ACXW4H_06690 [Candidatus Limnocylindrales bacterium]